MSQNKTAHLQMIQGIITRMGSNSFAMKGWTIGIMIAVYAFAGSDTKNALVITLIPMVVLAILDANYLLLERKHRALYENVRNTDEVEINFSMDIQNVPTTIKEADKFDLLRVLLSWSILPFYLVCGGVTLFLYLFS